jgi:hypothetical protein
MSLPVIVAPTFELVIPSTDKKVKCRPFLVKEEKILLMALESKTETVLVSALKQILENCIIEWRENSLEKLASFDLEYLLIKLRSKSKGEFLHLKYNGIQNSECEECKKPKIVPINLNEIQVIKDPSHTSKFQLTDEIGITMKYPQFSYIVQFSIGENQSEIETMFDMVKASIESIYTKDSVFLTKDYSDEDLEKFVDSLSSEQIEKVFSFFQTMPRLEHKIDLSCKSCGRKEEQILKGINSFFQ